MTSCKFYALLWNEASNDAVVCEVQSVSSNKIRNQKVHWQRDSIWFTTLLTIQILVCMKEKNRLWISTLFILFYSLKIPTLHSVFVPNSYKLHSIGKKATSEVIHSNIIIPFFLQSHVDGNSFPNTADTIVGEMISKIHLWCHLNLYPCWWSHQCGFSCQHAWQKRHPPKCVLHTNYQFQEQAVGSWCDKGSTVTA